MKRRECTTSWSLIFILFATSLLIGLSGCEREDVNQEKGLYETYHLQVLTIGEGEVDPSSGEFEELSNVQIAVKPAEGWKFFRWEGEVEDKDEYSTSILMIDDLEIKAIFVEENHGPGFSGWEGTKEKPFLIKTAEEFCRVRDYLDKHFLLIDDLDLAGYENWDPIGSFSFDGEELFYEAFTGSLDGRGHTITNLTLQRPQEENVGLFSITKGALLKNINLINVDVEGMSFVGSLAGRIGHESGCRIINVLVEGTLKGDFMVGGLVGLCIIGEIEESSSESSIEIEGFLTDGGLLMANTGGLVGFLSQGTIRDSSFEALSSYIRKLHIYRSRPNIEIKRSLKLSFVKNLKKNYW